MPVCPPIYHLVCPHTRYHIVSDGGHKALCPPSSTKTCVCQTRLQTSIHCPALHHTRSTVPQAVALNAADCSTALSSHSSRELVGHAKLLLGRGVFEGWRGVSCQVLCGSLAGEGTWRSAAYSRTATTEFPLWCEIERDTATQVGVRAASELAPARCGSPQRRKHLRSSRA
jgi:hypothetical protein